MKKYLSRFAVMLLAATLMLGSLCVSAAKYKSTVVSDDFSDSSKSLFVCPGDINFDGQLNAADLSRLVRILLEVKSTAYDDVVSEREGTEYSDVNGDNSVNIIDLVRVKKNIVYRNYFLDDGTMAFDGKCVYSESLVPQMGTGASYRISYRYKADSQVTVKFNSMGEEKEYVHSSSNNSWITAEHTVKTPLTKGEAIRFDLQIIGKGALDDFSITRINMDNELTAP